MQQFLAKSADDSNMPPSLLHRLNKAVAIKQTTGNMHAQVSSKSASDSAMSQKWAVVQHQPAEKGLLENDCNVVASHWFKVCVLALL